MSRFTRPPLVQETEKAKCPTCGNEFYRKREWQDFCSQECQMKYWHFTHPRPKKAIAPTDRIKGGRVPLDHIKKSK